jgi:ATP-binding protein involved in chromosome partitioning
VSSPATDALQTALAQVIDPELRRNVVELGMVDAVDVDGRHVHVTIRLTVPGCPLKSNIEAQVQMHVGAVPGVDGVSVGFTHMDEQQRAALRSQLRGGRSESERTIAVEERTRVIAIASGKGGVGKSSLTVNLALALRARGLEVGVVDADIYGYSIPGMLGIQQRPVVVDKMIVPPVAYDLKVMSIGFFLDDGGSVVWRGPMLHRALEQFLSDVYWGRSTTC